jgi:dTMP kinase
MSKGKLIVICGTDGSGKGTQFRLLIDRLLQDGIDIRMTDFPQYGKKSAGMVEEYLNGKYGSADDVGPYRASVFYACDRYDASHEMKRWIDEGKLIVSNRYVSANKGHQTGKIRDLAEREKYLDWLNNLEYNMFGIPKEDLNIMLYVPPEIGQKLVDKKQKGSHAGGQKRDIHEADINHLKNASDAYLYVAKKERWEIIDCTKNGELMTIKEIHEIIYELIRKKFPEFFVQKKLGEL